MIPNLYIENGLEITQRPFINGCLGFQAAVCFFLFQGRLDHLQGVPFLAEREPSKATKGAWTGTKTSKVKGFFSPQIFCFSGLEEESLEVSMKFPFEFVWLVIFLTDCIMV